MLHFAPWKIWSIIGACLVSLLLAIPNFLSKATLDQLPPWLPKKQISLGLDLRGGAHILLSMSTDEVRKAWLQTIAEDARKRLVTAKNKDGQTLGYEGRPAVVGKIVQVRPARPEDGPLAITELKKMIQPLTSGSFIGVGGPPDLEITADASGLITISPTEQAIQDRITAAISAAIETVRRRVDPNGTVEATIVQQGRDRILVQVPGIEDTTKLKELIGETALLTLHLLHPSISAEEAKARGSTPTGYRIYESADGLRGSYLLAEPAIRGDDIAGAQPATDSRTGEPVVSFQLKNAGARVFGQLTTDNVGKPFAIVLDGKVLSAPVIQDKILGGSAQISGRFSFEEVTKLALQLRSGALPAKLTIIEERSVGPTLGADSIEAGSRAGIIGGIVTMIMTIAAYGTFGIFAVIALLVNGLMIVAIMSLMGSTLTLPGIAGLVLTIGMAVDANVLIYERIREELRAGRTAIAAIDAGFSRAIVTIADSQLTTLAAAIIMFWLGSGPIRGFAVTLTIGIFTSVFTAVTVTRLLVSWWLKNARARQKTIEVPI
ncbi:MAG TPA: protein translocase subunit SecD [Hyphomicrobiaceae bacterium]|nr:protein translocase subunit SecD [Hyphomicrobiaceae bacterium]